jgi:uncharacterized membrane protein YbhN (UPF0104 family)
VKKRPLATLRFALAAIVITFVATRVPWRDRVTAPEDGAWIEGEIAGDWRADTVLFTIAKGELVPIQWKDGWASELREASSAELVRGDAVWEPGLARVLGGLRSEFVLAVFLSLLGGVLFGVTRWWRLLGACGVATPYWTAARLTLLGMFFNLVVPGLTGGDVVKAGLAAKEHPEGKGAAITAIGIDRVIGLWTLLVIAAGCAIALPQELASLVVPLTGLALAGSLGLIAACSPRLRDGLGFNRLLALLPGRFSGIADALRGLAQNPSEVVIAIALSAGNHLCIGVAIFSVARGIGDATSFLGCMSASAVASAVSAVPLAPGGWGVGEAAYAGMFSLLGAGETVGYAVSVSYRLCQTGLALACGAALWRGNRPSLGGEAAAISTP